MVAVFALLIVQATRAITNSTGVFNHAPSRIAPFLGGKLPPVAPVFAGGWRLVQSHAKLEFEDPLGVQPFPGTRDLIVWERQGCIWAFENKADVSEKRLLLDISNKCQGWDDCGLLGLAFHPQFADNRQVFIYYKWVPPGTVQGSAEKRPPAHAASRNRIARFTLRADGTADPASETVIVDQPTESLWHNGGGLFFNPRDGFLYFSNGDDARPQNHQRIDGGIFAGVFRIDVDCRGGNISHEGPTPPVPPDGVASAPYFIPDDNPFCGIPEARDEYFALGLRNPHRMTLDETSGRIFIGDVGESTREEINVIEPADPRGLNFQANRIEGSGHELTPPYPGVSRQPKLDFGRADGRSVIGGYVYRGRKWAKEIGGQYIFGDNVTGAVWAMDEKTKPVGKHVLCEVPRPAGASASPVSSGLASFGYDHDGELLLCVLNGSHGSLLRLERDGATPPVMPRILSKTGVFQNIEKLRLVKGFTSYEVNSPLWSDGAEKRRWFAIPDGTQIAFRERDAWVFPAGSVFVKHFELPAAHGAKRLETRVLVKDAIGGVYGASYRWRADGSDADIVDAGCNVEIVPSQNKASSKTQPWYFPGRGDCLACHTTAAGGVLGLNTRQANRVPTQCPEGTPKQNQLSTWSQLHLLEHSTDALNTATLPKLVPLTDSNASLEQRVRSYLDSNCAHCHRPGGVHAFWDARYETPLTRAGILGGMVQNNLGLQDARIVVPGHPENSVMLHRMSHAGTPDAMPPLGKSIVDEHAVGLLNEWILHLPQPPPPAAPGKPWREADVGTLARAGHAVQPRDGAFALTAGGRDIWEKQDSFHFLYRTLKGDGQITAHIASLTPTSNWAKAGVMIRESLAPDAPHAMMAITPGQGAAFQYRPQTGGESQHTSGPNITAPFWVRIIRHGDEVAGLVSSDGREWTEVGRTVLTTEGRAMVGLPCALIIRKMKPRLCSMKSMCKAISMTAMLRADTRSGTCRSAVVCMRH